MSKTCSQCGDEFETGYSEHFCTDMCEARWHHEERKAEEECARAEIEAERRMEERKERHFDRHGHFGPGHDPGPD